jgi:hypothetical protein
MKQLAQLTQMRTIGLMTEQEFDVALQNLFA